MYVNVASDIYLPELWKRESGIYENGRLFGQERQPPPANHYQGDDTS